MMEHNLDISLLGQRSQSLCIIVGGCVVETNGSHSTGTHKNSSKLNFIHTQLLDAIRIS